MNHATRLPACDSLTIPSRAKPLDQRQPNTRVENGSSATAPGDGCPRGHLRIKATVPSPLNLHCASSSPRQRIQSLNFEPCVPAGGKWYLQKGIRPDASSVHGLPVRKRDVRRVQPPVYSVDGPDSEVIKFEFLHQSGTVRQDPLFLLLIHLLVSSIRGVQLQFSRQVCCSSTHKSCEESLSNSSKPMTTRRT